MSRIKKIIKLLILLSEQTFEEIHDKLNWDNFIYKLFLIQHETDASNKDYKSHSYTIFNS